MSSLPWFRMYSRIMSDPDVEELAFEDQRHFVWLLCIKNDGHLDKGYEGDRLDRMVARKLGLQGEALAATKRRLIESTLIDAMWQPRSWDDLQFASDSSTDRVRAYRKRQKSKSCAASPPVKRRGNVTVTAQETDTDTDTEKTDTSVSPSAKASERSPRISVDDHRKVIALYHKLLPELTPVVVSRWHGSAHAKQLAARWKEDPRFRTGVFWKAFFETVRENDWWMGRTTGKDGQPWTGCKLAWLVKRANFDKVLEAGGFE